MTLKLVSIIPDVISIYRSKIIKSTVHFITSYVFTLAFMLIWDGVVSQLMLASWLAISIKMNSFT